jgi:catechol 2,3-dioxygenase-like lactoylglutathione lyase family enzyme
MSTPSPLWLRGLDVGAPGAPRTQAFYEELWGLSAVAGDDQHVYLRGTGAEQYILGLHDRLARGIVHINFGLPDADALARYREEIASKGAQVISDIAPAATPGGGVEFRAIDPDRRVLRFVAGVERHGDAGAGEDRPRKVSHVVLNSEDLDGAKDFYCDVLGFRVSDWSEDQMVFLRCSEDHHSIAFNRADRNSINHVAFEMPTIDAFMRGIGRMKNGGYPVNWGPGRHGPGNNPFAYYIGPNGFVIEYTCEVQQIDEASHEAKVWPRKPPLSDLWGTAGPPTAQMRMAMAGEPDPGYRE